MTRTEAVPDSIPWWNINLISKNSGGMGNINGIGEWDINSAKGRDFDIFSN